MRVLVEFREIFAPEEEKPLHEFLDGISRATLLNVGAFFLGFSNNNSKYDDYGEFISMFFRQENNDFATQVFNKCEALSKRLHRELLIVNPESSLQLFEYAFAHISEESTQTEAESERNLFKAYLLLNQQNTANSKIASESCAHVDKMHVHALTLAMSFGYCDIINYDLPEVVATQLIKSIYFFEFLSEHHQTQVILQHFLKEFDCSTWQEYLKSFLPLTMAVTDNKKESHTDIQIIKDEGYQKTCAFIDKLIVTDAEEISDFDFKIIRAKPFYKISDGNYRIIYGLFVAEKIFKSLYFFLAEINKNLQKETGIANFKSFYCDEFSEKILLYRTLNHIFQDKWLKYTGDQMRALGLTAEPDYYARKGTDVFLFEGKDVLIRADIKQSYDYAQYEEEFRKKFYYDKKKGKTQNKAILQLIHNIKNLLIRQFSVDTEYHYKNINIYPVLVVFDRMFNVVGLHQLLNKWFDIELMRLKAKGLFVYRVQPLIIVDIDTLIFQQDSFKDEILSLADLIDEYKKLVTIPPLMKFRTQTDAENRVENTLVPFSLYINRWVKDKNIYKAPAILEESGLRLF